MGFKLDLARFATLDSKIPHDIPDCPLISTLWLKDLHLKYLYIISCTWKVVFKKLRESMRSINRINFEPIYQNKPQEVGLNSYSFKHHVSRCPHLATLPVIPEQSVVRNKLFQGCGDQLTCDTRDRECS